MQSAQKNIENILLLL